MSLLSFLGPAANFALSVYDSGKAERAGARGYHDEQAFWQGERNYDLVKSIPALGSALTMMEVLGGAKSKATGHGFENGRHAVRDDMKDMGAWAFHTSSLTHPGDHRAQREDHETHERFEPYLEHDRIAKEVDHERLYGKGR